MEFFTYLLIFFFIGMFASMKLIEFLEERKAIKALKVVLVFNLIASLYCLVAGVYLALNWQDPFAQASSEQLGSAAASHGGKGGIVILAIRFWPYVLIGFGGMFAFRSFVTLRNMMKQQ